MSADRPDRPGVAALVSELEVRRHVRTALLAGGGFALAVFALFAYLPGTEESLLYWAALTFVLGSAVSGLVATGLLALAAYRRTLAVNDIEAARPSSTTLAVGLGLLGWVLVPVAATLVFEEVTGGVALALGQGSSAGPANELTVLVAVVTGAFAVLAVGGLGVGLVAALSLSHEWRPFLAGIGGVGYTVLVAAPAVGCPSGGPCLGTPDQLVAATVGLDPSAIAPPYAAIALGGGLLVGVVLGRARAAPPHGFFAGCVATAASLPIVAAATGDPAVVADAALYLPAVLGTVGAVGGGIVYVFRHPDGRSSSLD